MLHSDNVWGRMFNHSNSFLGISQKHVDFQVCRADDWMPMLAIEVDDSSHQRKDRRERDWFVNNLFAHVGVPLLRVPVQEVAILGLLVNRLAAAILSQIRLTAPFTTTGQWIASRACISWAQEFYTNFGKIASGTSRNGNFMPL